MTDRSSVIFGNKMPDKVYKKAVKSKKKYMKKFGDDSRKNYEVSVEKNRYIGDSLGVYNILVGNPAENAHYDVNAHAEKGTFDTEKGIIVGNIRMGFGHYRISMAMASAAKAMGYTPYWMDLNSYGETTCTKVIGAQNDLYSLGSRLSKNPIFNKLVWEPMNYEGFRALSYNAADQKNAELMAPVYRNVPKDIPVIGTHVWPAQAAVHAGMKYVVNAIPDNWPMALHLSEGSVHTIQCHNSYMGYRILNGMNKDKVNNPMPSDSLVYTGHYIDYELVQGIEADCEARIKRKENGEVVIISPKTTYKLDIKHVKELSAPPQYIYGECVSPCNHPDMIGIVCDIAWHFKLNCYFYIIKVNGRPKSKRYYDGDLNPIV